MTQYTADERTIERNSELINRDDVQQYISMLSYRRPSGTVFNKTYQEFIEKFLTPVFGEPDKHGNFIKIINDAQGGHPRIAYMAHHDTVHRNNGRQSTAIKYSPEAIGDVYLYIKNDNVPRIEKTSRYSTGKKDHKGNLIYKEQTYQTIDVTSPDYSDCLGADCTTGVWLILQMIEAGCPGVYVIHEDEEIGCVGSGCIVDDYKRLTDEQKEEHWISKVDIAMSFDRYGETSIITYQSSSRTASDSFASALSEMTEEFFRDRGYLSLQADNGGSYTDSNEYCDVISECTNISVGYYNQHSDKEKQNVDYLLMLRDCLIHFADDMNDPKKLPASRNPLETDYLYSGYGIGYQYGGMYRPNYTMGNYNRRDNSYYEDKEIYDPYDPFYYNENPFHEELNDHFQRNLELEENSTMNSHSLSLNDIENIEYQFEDYITQTADCGDIFNVGSEEEIEEISELLRLFPYLAASLLQKNNIGSREFMSRIKGEAIRRERLLSYEKLFKIDKEKKEEG